MTLQTERVRTLDQVRAFVEGSGAVDFTGADRESVYEFVRRALVRLDYAGLGKSDKGLVRRYLAKVTGLSRAQLTRLIGQHRETGRIEDRRGGAPACPFERRYTRADIRLLAAVDAAMGQMSGPATRALMRRQYEVFGDERFERLAGLSNGHLYNLRRSVTYRRRRTVVAKTQATHNAIGQRRKPRPDGQPGYVRVDTVHQGDQDGAKGVYHVNMVDDVTQFQLVGTVQAISERFLLPVLEGLIEAFPFVVQGIHADNGSEYINHRVAALLNKLHVGEFTKSRPRHCNDNALAESKNASVVRKHLGHGHIARRFAPQVNEFTQHVLSPFLNYHRPCLFPSDTLDAKGRITKRYHDRDVMTPYDKLKSLDHPERFLKPRVTFDQLDAAAHAVSDPRRRPRAQQRPRRPVPHHRARLARRGLTLPTPTIHRPAPSGRWPPLWPLHSHRPNASPVPIGPASAPEQATARGLRRSFVPFNIPLPFTHFPTPPTAPSPSPPSGSSSYWKRLPAIAASRTPPCFRDHGANSTGPERHRR